MPVQGDNGPSRRDKLSDLIERWQDLDQWIKNLSDDQKEAAEQFPDSPYMQKREQRRELRERIGQMVFAHPKLYDFAVSNGFPADLLPESDRSAIQHGTGGGDGGTDTDRASDQHGTGGTDGGTSGGGGGGTGSGGGGSGGGGGTQQQDQNFHDNAVDNRLLGEKGKHYDLVRGPKGSYVIRYKFKIRGEVVSVGLKVGRDQLSKYGFKPENAKRFTAAQMKQIKNIGYADELAPHIRKGDGNVLKSLVRSLGHQYGGQAILEDDQVMSVIIANSLFGWSAGEFENELRNTKWYRNTNDYQRQWVTVTSPKQKRDTIRQYQERVIDQLEDYYGLNWSKHVQGGMRTAKEWAEKIASGRWGTPDAGFAFWASRQFDKAAEIESTPAWIQRESEEEERRARLNRPEDMYETLRQQSDQWLGERYRPDRATLMKWANDLVSEKKSDHDWMGFLRQQSKALHPWKNDDTPWQDVASTFRGIAEDILRKPVDFNDKLFSNLGNEKGTAPLSAYDFELMVRQDNRAWAEGSRLWDEGTAIGMQLANMFSGVTF